METSCSKSSSHPRFHQNSYISYLKEMYDYITGIFLFQEEWIHTILFETW